MTGKISYKIRQLINKEVTTVDNFHYISTSLRERDVITDYLDQLTLLKLISIKHRQVGDRSQNIT